MSVAVVTGSHGLVGSAVSLSLAGQGLTVVGVENNLRAKLFGSIGSTEETGKILKSNLGDTYVHHEIDIRDRSFWVDLCQRYGKDIKTVVHTAAQPSHDWSASDPMTDFEINAVATIHILEAVRTYCPDSSIVFMSTNKVYGDAVNRLDVVELSRRLDLRPEDDHFSGISEAFPVDQATHSPFGVSKLSADLAVQEYGRYYGLSTVCLRAGTITGRQHSAVQLHGFLAYLAATAKRTEPYTVIGYGGKQVRDVIHASDVAAAISLLVLDPPAPGSVYNVGGGRTRSCSVLEAVDLIEEGLARSLHLKYVDVPRKGDHRWWISNMTAFQLAYPAWRPRFELPDIVAELLSD